MMETSAALVAFFKTLLPGIFGAAIASILGKGRTFFARLCAFFFGVAIAHYAGGGVIEYAPIQTSAMQDLVKFSLGLFGMRIFEQIEIQIPLFIRGLRIKISGSTPESKSGDLQ